MGVLLDELDRYRAARRRLLTTLHLPDSNRDPIAEFCEHFACAIIGGRLADNCVQRDWDIAFDDGTYAQVRYLANPADRWVNEHHIRSIPGVEWYVVVLLDAFHPTAVLAFPPDVAPICAALGKRHGSQAETLQFTRRNWWMIRDDPEAFVQRGMRIWLPPFVSPST